MNLPSGFVSNIQNTFPEEGRAFLEGLPEAIARACQLWNLENVQPVPDLSYNFVAFAQREVRHGEQQSQEVVLKMGVPNREFRSELAALRLLEGEGACRLIEHDEERYWMLLERLQPGVMLSALKDDEEATRIAADVMQRIWRPAPEGNPFIRLADWFQGLKRLRARFDGRTGPLDERLVGRVEASVRDLLAENHRPVLLHGDFHHFNVLLSERGWLVIDPKGVLGPACYEVGPLLMNPWRDLSSGREYPRLTARRIDILHDQLGFERERIREWALAHAILSAWWGIEDNTGWAYAARFAEMLAGLA